MLDALQSICIIEKSIKSLCDIGGKVFGEVFVFSSLPFLSFGLRRVEF